MQISPVSSVSAAVQAQEPRPTGTATAANVGRAPMLNPQPVIDPALGIVVTESVSQDGVITDEYPTARALETYRLYGLHAGPDGKASAI